MAKWYKAVNNPAKELGSFVENRLLPEKFKSTLGDIPILNDMISRGWLGQGGQQLTDEGREAEAKNQGTAKTMAEINAIITLAALAYGGGAIAGGMGAGSGVTNAGGTGITGGGGSAGAGLQSGSYGSMGNTGSMFAPQGNLYAGGQSVGSGSMYGSAGAGLPTTSYGQLGTAGLQFAPQGNLTTSGGSQNSGYKKNNFRQNNQQKQKEEEWNELEKKKYPSIIKEKSDLEKAFMAYLMQQYPYFARSSYVA